MLFVTLISIHQVKVIYAYIFILKIYNTNIMHVVIINKLIQVHMFRLISSYVRHIYSISKSNQNI